jgi:hypothetical protein
MLQREDSSCQPGAVHKWPIATEIMSAGMSAIRVEALVVLNASFVGRDPIRKYQFDFANGPFG